MGVIRGSVLLAEHGDDLLVIDLVRARTAVVAAELRRHPGALGGSMRMLLPEMVSMGHAKAKRLVEQRDVLYSHGVDVDTMGPGEVVVKAAPAGLRGVVWTELLDELTEYTDVVTVLARAHARAQASPSEYARRALLAALDELDLLDAVAKRISLSGFLSQ